MKLPVISVSVCSATIGDYFLTPIVLLIVKFEDFEIFVSEELVAKKFNAIGFCETPKLSFDGLEEGVFAKRVGDTGPFYKTRRVITTHNCPGDKVTLVWPDESMWTIERAI